ncbi:MAG: class I SAM-dependent methyltransferase, partial [Anaerolineae bacterium]
MDLVTFYDDYWRDKPDIFDQTRLDIVASYVGQGENVLAVDCGPGVLARQLADKGNRVTGVDMSHVAVGRARERGIEAQQVDLDSAPLPFAAETFDTVVSDSGLEHR